MVLFKNKQYVITFLPVKKEILNNQQGRIFSNLSVTFFGLSVAPIAIDNICRLSLFGLAIFVSYLFLCCQFLPVISFCVVNICELFCFAFFFIFLSFFSLYLFGFFF